jgi:hypothetical protein
MYLHGFVATIPRCGAGRLPGERPRPSRFAFLSLKRLSEPTPYFFLPQIGSFCVATS